MKATKFLRHVWREVNDGNGPVKVLALQQWYRTEGWEHADYVKNGGEWQDVEVSTSEREEGPNDE